MDSVESFREILTQKALEFGPNVIAAVAILVLGYIAAKLLTGLLRGAMRRGSLDATLIGFLGNLVYMGLMALVVIAALGRLGVETASFAALIAAAGLAVGFALQGSLSNFAAGVMLIVFRPFKEGDFVEAAGVSGIVEEIQVFATVLRTPDNKQVIIGNGAIYGDSITNYSAKDTRRIDMVFGVGYDDDLAKAKSIIERCIADDTRVLDDPAPTIGLLELGDSSVNFAVRPWVKTADYWDVYFALNEKIKLAFDGAGISIPFPQTDVHLHQVGQGQVA